MFTKKLIHYSSYNLKGDQYDTLVKKHGVYLPSKNSAVMTDDYVQGVFVNKYFSFKIDDITWEPLTCPGKTANQIFFEISKAFRDQ